MDFLTLKRMNAQELQLYINQAVMPNDTRQFLVAIIEVDNQHQIEGYSCVGVKIE